MSTELMRLAEAARRCACSVRTIRRAIESGRLIAVRLGESGKSDRIHPEDLAAWWKSCRTLAPPVPCVAYAKPAKLPMAGADQRLAELLGIKPKPTAATKSAARRSTGPAGRSRRDR